MKKPQVLFPGQVSKTDSMVPSRRQLSLPGAQVLPPGAGDLQEILLGKGLQGNELSLAKGFE